MKPDVRFLLSHPAHLIALGFGSGLAGRAPGTFGTMFGWASYVLLAPYLGLGSWVVLLVVGFAVGCWACRRTGIDLGVADHGGMVWDEIIAIWLVLLFAERNFSSLSPLLGLLWQAVAFGVFRFFDIVKPPPIKRFERRFKTGRWAGFGVMGDDLIAAFYSLLTMALVVRAYEGITTS